MLSCSGPFRFPECVTHHWQTYRCKNFYCRFSLRNIPISAATIQIVFLLVFLQNSPTKPFRFLLFSTEYVSVFLSNNWQKPYFNLLFPTFPDVSRFSPVYLHNFFNNIFYNELSTVSTGFSTVQFPYIASIFSLSFIFSKMRRFVSFILRFT